jgi:hypothetical protein
VDVTRQRRALAARLGGGQVEKLAAEIYVEYRAIVAETIAGWIMRLDGNGAARVRNEAMDTPLWDADRLRVALAEHLRVLPPAEFPPATTVSDAALWFTTYDTVVRAGAVLIDVLRVALGVARIDSADLRHRIAALRMQAHDVLDGARKRRDAQAPTSAQRHRLTADALEALRAGDLSAWAETAVAQCFGAPGDWLGDVQALADLLPPAVAALEEALEGARQEQAAGYRRAAGLVDGLRSDTRDAALRRLLALEVVELALGDQPPALDQKVELIQVSADGPNGFDGRTRPEDKLNGLQLGHFGAFYQASWRANDWLWGRVDAATRLSQLLLEPARLRQLEFTRPQGWRTPNATHAAGSADPHHMSLPDSPRKPRHVMAPERSGQITTRSSGWRGDQASGVEHVGQHLGDRAYVVKR